MSIWTRWCSRRLGRPAVVRLAPALGAVLLLATPAAPQPSSLPGYSDAGVKAPLQAAYEKYKSLNEGKNAKSGVGGGIIAVSPGKFGIAVVSPPLGQAGNSVRAQKAIAGISSALGDNPLAPRPR